MSASLASSGPNRDSGIPRALTPLVGRVWEVASAGALLRDPHVRLLTLTGPGGVGKTRLAMRVAELAEPDFAQGVEFVALASVREPEMVLAAIADQLKVPVSGETDPGKRLSWFVADRQLLLVLDNFEHVIESASGVSRLLSDAPALKVLVTSREPLRLSGEQEFAVGPMTLPDSGSKVTATILEASDAGSLFLQRARAVLPAFELTDQTAAPVNDICRRLDGLPLAIELAASRVKILPPAALLARLNDRLSLLTEGPRDAPHRLQTMNAAIGWSYDLLTPDEQVVFRRLAVFPAGCVIDAAAAVTGQDVSRTFELITSLVDRSLLTHRTGVSGEIRFSMLETIREFALSKLQASKDEEDARRRQAAWVESFVLESRPIFRTRQNVLSWLRRFEEENDNIRAAFDWVESAGEWESAMRMCGSLYWYWDFREYLVEGRARFARVIDHAPVATPGEWAHTWFGAALLDHWQGAEETAESYAGKALAAAREAHDTWTEIISLGLMGVIAEDTCRYAEAYGLLEAAMALAREHGYPSGMAIMCNHLGLVSWALGNQTGAIEYWEEALSLHRQIGDRWGEGVSLGCLGIAACERNDASTALTMHAESLACFLEYRNADDLANGLANMAVALVLSGLFERAARLFGASDAARAVAGAPPREPEHSIRLKYLQRARETLGNTAFDYAWAEGQALSIDDAVSEALLPVEREPAIDQRFYDLTARELDVLRLIAEGRSDREIAEQLFISTRTAQGHVSHILAKMGVPSRTAATSLAIRDGITTRYP